MRAKTTTMGSKNMTAYLKATKELPHRSMANDRAKKGIPGNRVIWNHRTTHNSSIFEKKLA
jgi:hypothetical protein